MRLSALRPIPRMVNLMQHMGWSTTSRSVKRLLDHTRRHQSSAVAQQLWWGGAFAQIWVIRENAPGAISGLLRLHSGPDLRRGLYRISRTLINSRPEWVFWLLFYKSLVTAFGTRNGTSLQMYLGTDFQISPIKTGPSSLRPGGNVYDTKPWS